MRTTRFIGGLLVAVAVLVPVTSSALTTEEIQAQIQALREQIAELQKQLRELRPEPIDVPPAPHPQPRERRVCALLTHDIPFGSNSDIVRAIQEALAEDRAIYPEGLTTGYFGPLTQSAIQRLHDRLEVQGFATTTFPLGEHYRIGPWLREILLRYWCSNAFSPLTPGQPIISSFEGPTELIVNQFGTWTVQASDPENDALQYKVLWGDESVQDQLLELAEPDTGAFTASTTFTHAYARVRRYVVRVVVRDGTGNTARAVAMVKVTPVFQEEEEEENAPVPLPDSEELRKRVCPLIGQFGRVLTEGAQGDDVRGLQELLRAEGFLNVAPTGYLGPLTRNALQGWQGAHNICGIGLCPNVFDRNAYEQTLQRIRTWCGGFTAETPPVVACTQDAMQCPDGTYVGRTGPNCEFKCSTTNTTGTCVHNGQMYESGQYTEIDCGETACWNSGKVYVCRNGSFKWDVCYWGNALGPRDPLSCLGGTATRKTNTTSSN